MKKIEIRSNGTKRVYTVNNEPAKTDPSYLKETDVNYIIHKFTKTGQITHLAKKQGSFADVSFAPDLLTAMQKIKESSDSWNSLPDVLKERFSSPQQLLKFLMDPKNREEAIKLGLLETTGLIQNESAGKGAEDVPEEQPVAKDGHRERPPRVKAPKQEQIEKQA